MVAVRLLLAGLGLGLVGFAGLQARTEYRAFVQARPPGYDFLLGIDEAGFDWVPARAVRTENRQMTLCIIHQQSLMARVQPAARRAALARACLVRAGKILSGAPTRSVAHLAMAVSQARLNEAPAALDALAASAATGAHEGWIGRERLRLALDIATAPGTDPALTARALALAGPDVALLLADPLSVDDLVALYRAIPAAQDWLIRQIEARPATGQQRFLTQLRAAAAAEAGAGG